MTQTERISLYYREGSSHKEYHIQLASVSEGRFAVHVQYGRRHSTLTEASKTSTPVPYDQAKKVYDRLVKEKTGKGYTEGLSGTPYQGSAKSGLQSGLLPQLLNPIDHATAFQLLDDPYWVMQEKIDGRRVMLQRKAGEILGSNREGTIIAVPATVAEAATCLSGDFVLDGEAVGATYFVFDLLELRGDNLRSLGVVERHRRLLRLVPPGAASAIQVVPLMETVEDKRELFHHLLSTKAEGMVFKRAHSAYVPGRPNSGGDSLKYKFTADTTCFVRRINAKRSVELGMESSGGPVGVGNVSIPPNHEIPGEGDLVRVRYLYAYHGGSLFQPVYLGSRANEGIRKADDITTLKYKQDETEDDA